MPKTNAERQRDWRQRQHATGHHQAQRISELEAALDAQHAALLAERDLLQADLDAAHADIERLTASQCRHPAGAVDGGTCRACGTDVWNA